MSYCCDGVIILGRWPLPRWSPLDQLLGLKLRIYFKLKVLVLGLMLIEKVVLISRVTLQVIVVVKVKVQFQVLGLIVYVAF